MRLKGLKRFSNSGAPASLVKGGFFLGKKPLSTVLPEYSYWRTAIAIFAVLLALSQALAAVGVQASAPTSVNRQTPPISAPSTGVPQETASPAPKTEGEGGIRDIHPPHMSVANPAPAPSPLLAWSVREQITWAANLVLVILGYVGIMMAVSLLKKIDRQTKYAETAAEAAAASSHAALINAQAILQAERAWILISVEPSPSAENSFTVMATNRGRTPARIMEIAEQTRIAIDQEHLPSPPEYSEEKRSVPFAPIILLPGESAAVKPFCRNDVRGLCDSEERFRRIETWEEKIFLYGKVIYKDLTAPVDSEAHESNWCCWYIHGRQNSGLVIAGMPEYNTHT
jgi:hypothetical protein